MLNMANHWSKLTYCQVGRRHRLHCCHSFDAAHIGQAMLIVIPPAIRQVNAAHKCHGLVNNDEFLVVGPEVHGGGHVVRVSHHLGRKPALKLSIIARFTSLQAEGCPAGFFLAAQDDGETLEFLEDASAQTAVVTEAT